MDLGRAYCRLFQPKKSATLLKQRLTTTTKKKGQIKARSKERENDWRGVEITGPAAPKMVRLLSFMAAGGIHFFLSFSL